MPPSILHYTVRTSKMPKERTLKEANVDKRAIPSCGKPCTKERPSDGCLNDSPSSGQRGTTIPTNLSRVVAQVAGLGVNSSASIH